MCRTIKTLILSVLLVFLSYGANAQTVSVSGVVVDASELPVIGAAVMVKGTDIGAVTDEDGKFSFNSLSSSAILEASALGYATATCPVGNGKVKIILTASCNKIT